VKVEDEQSKAPAKRNPGGSLVKLLQSVAETMSIKLLTAQGGHVGIFL